MIQVQAIVRPEKVHAVMKALLDGGFPAVTKIDVFGRGKQRGYAYLTWPQNHRLSVAAEKRLTVMQTLDALRAAGYFKVALVGQQQR